MQSPRSFTAFAHIGLIVYEPHQNRHAQAKQKRDSNTFRVGGACFFENSPFSKISGYVQTGPKTLYEEDQPGGGGHPTKL